MRKNIIICVASFGLAVTSAHAFTNSWASTGGKWEASGKWDSFSAPDISQDAEVVSNAVNKLITIDATTVSGSPTTLTIKNLLLSGPVNTTNTIQLNNPGTTTAFDVASNLSVSANAILQGTNGQLRVSSGQFNIDSNVRLTNCLFVSTNALVTVGPNATGTVNLINTTWLASNVVVRSGTLTVNGGSNSVNSLLLTNGASSVLVYNRGTITTRFATVANGGVLQFALGSSSIPVAVSSNLSLDGTLNVTDGGGFTSTTYQLFTYGGTLTFNSLTVGTTPNPSFTYTISTATTGQVNLVITSTNAPSLTPFQQWQIAFFGSTNDPNAALTADPDGDGQNNQSEFFANTTPTNNASAFGLISVVRQANDFVITWKAAGGTTNIVQVSTGTGNGSYTNNFADLSPRIIVAGSGDVTTNYTDVGGATNTPSRFYRVRVSPSNGAADNASDSAYNSGWNTGNNGGYGFGAWTLTASGVIGSGTNGYFIGSSGSNAGTGGPSIDVAGESWGTYANSGNFTAAYRALNGSLQVGQSFALNMDNGGIDSGQSVGFSLRNGNATSGPSDYSTGSRLQFFYTGFDATNSYKVVDAGGQQNIGVGFTGTGLRINFTLTGANTYTLTVVNNASGSSTNFSGTLAGSGTVDSIALFNRNAGSGSSQDAFFNSLQLTGFPTP